VIIFYPRLKSQPSRVRFAESVDIDGQTDPSRATTTDSVVPLMPNVLKVFLENGQTKSFKYDTTTRVQVGLKSNIEDMHTKVLTIMDLLGCD
jgi:hypothetical protein